MEDKYINFYQSNKKKITVASYQLDSSFGIFDIKQSLFLKDKLTPMPLSSFQSKLSLKNKIGNGLPLCYIRCKNPLYEPLELSRKRVEDFGWPIYDLNAGHDGMISHPHDTINLFYKILAEQLK